MSSWQKPVVDLINRFGGNTAHLWPLLEIMTVFPEEVNSRSLRYIVYFFAYLMLQNDEKLNLFYFLHRLGANHRQHILHELNTNADTVTEFLVCIALISHIITFLIYVTIYYF